MGANSGPLTQRTHLFYEGRHDILTDLRVHIIPSIFDVFDYNSNANGMTYENDLNLGGFVIDGVQDAPVAGLPQWEQISGTAATISIVHRLLSDIVQPADGSFGSYYDDSSTNENSTCTGDGEAWSTSGVGLDFQNVCTDPLLPNCMGTAGERYLKAIRVIYADDPGAGASAANYSAQYDNLLQVAVDACTATFTLTLSTDPAGTGIISGSGNYSDGDIVSVSAGPLSGYEFLYWTDGGTIVSNNSSFSFTITQDTDLVAHFELDICLGSPNIDSDMDGVCDGLDVCPGFDDTVDSDMDSVPNGCDICPNVATDDSDGDGVCDDVDICAGGDDSLDADMDGTPDFCDVCPNSATGDSDGDGVCDDVDICAGGDDSLDADMDGTPDFCDACPNSATGDTDGDGVCDDVDMCEGFDDANDADMDGTPDACDVVEVSLRVKLEGAMLADGSMRTSLQSAGLIPNSHPYGLVPYNHPPENPAAAGAMVVDWVLVEARSGTPASVPGPPGTAVVETHVGFLMSDGWVVHPITGAALEFASINVNDSYYFAVRHRNHLDVMSSLSLPATAGAVVYDFTSAESQAIGVQQQIAYNGSSGVVWTLHAGDFNQDGVIQNTDFDDWVVDPSIINNYKLTDGNLDGTVQTTDYDAWFLNKAKIGNVEIQY